ncbi:hypothetical protein PMZ80_001432 [Knufia obscura]|uniref:Uncharacterized protein n=2 Tax=Knufia TaxID=430999 RepID=A0AAN8EQ98_9EURO|nr:hypothetical protein PMZ80_001432 [Knufia obscura]KAK5956172.1 hypothetical protein OHC33_002745 [Knufia fluminis]
MTESPAAGSSSSTASTLPRTPQPPFSPPRRSSSLAFSANRSTKGPPAQSSAPSAQTIVSPNQPQPNIGRKRLVAPPPPHDAPSPVHVAQMQRIFQNAKATLHRDMAAASSPASSIESRMNLDPGSPAKSLSIGESTGQEQDADADRKTWRYSTAPQNLAAVSVDVREPLPSPTLPDLLLHHISHGTEGIEAVSSGFTSPNMRESFYGIHEAIATALPSSGDESEDDGNDSKPSIDAVLASSIEETELEKPLTQLKLTTEDTDDESSEESPIVRHLKRRSCGTSMELELPSSPERSIFLSETAEAAANSAKAKRKLLKGILNDQADDGHVGGSTVTGQSLDMRASMRCPDPAVHRLSAGTPCPEPYMHSQSPLMMQRPVSAAGSGMAALGQDGGQFIQHVPVPGASRATSTGSPMPFARGRARPATADGYAHPQHISPYMREQLQMNTLHEHFSPGWYYVQEPMRPTIRPTLRPQYSFSTAASRSVGADQAPDSRIRDSYKTDTLTALAKPPSRYRKNGIGAEAAPRGVSRYYQRPPSSMRPPSAQSRPSSRRTYTSGEDVRFRSSPPRVPGPEHYIPARRKRAMDDSFVIAEDVSDQITRPTLRLQGSDDIMEVDEQTKAAVRMSIFGTNPPEALHQARRGLKELSPNVQVYRKGTQENAHLRKKRRPSYWDNDLKEVRESPAGRGGVNSPVSAQESMRAEFEIASLNRTEMDLDEDDLSGEVARAGMDLEKRLNAFRTEKAKELAGREVEAGLGAAG